VHWQGKFRGPDFSPMLFRVETKTHERLKDSKGRLIPNVVASHLSETAQEEISAAAGEDANKVLAAINAHPKAPLAELAIALGWKLYDQSPNKMKVKRIVDRLKSPKVKLIEADHAGVITITDKGRKALEKISPAKVDEGENHYDGHGEPPHP